MPDPNLSVKISCTEAPQFVRLVDLLSELALYAATHPDLDEELVGIIDRCGDDLVDMGGAER